MENKRSKKETLELKKKLGYVPYDILPILSTNAHYMLVWSERSNGKTFGALQKAVEMYWKTQKRSVYLRRYDVDIKGRKAEEIVGGINADGYISKLTNGVYDRIHIKNRKGYLARYDDDLEKIICDDKPFLYFYALNTMSHDKGTFIENLKYIIFDEFIEPSGSGGYLPDEFTLFKNALSTFIRYRDDVTVLLLGNTLNPFNPYFEWLCLKNARQQKQGTIEVYKSEKDGLTTVIACEYAESSKRKNGGIGKPSDIYFTFEKSSMVTEGAWELKEYPQLQVKYKKEDIQFIYFIVYHEYILQCEIICKDNYTFTYIHRKTTEIKNYDKELIYTPNYHYEPNYSRNIKKYRTKLEKNIYWYFYHNKVFYQDNVIGDIVNNYLNDCDQME